MLTDTEVQLCHWHWIPGCAGSHVWTNDPEFRRSKGGGGIVVGRVEEVKPKRGTKGRSSERIVLVRPQFRGGEWAYWIGHWKMKRYLKTSEIRALAKDEGWGAAMSGEEPVVPAFTSAADMNGCNVLLRIVQDGAVRGEDGGRVGRKGDRVPIVLRKNDVVAEIVTQWDYSHRSWAFVHGSSRRVKFRIAPECHGSLPGYELWGDVAALGTDGQWRELMPDGPGPVGLYLFSVPVGKDGGEPEGGSSCYWGTKRMTFAEIVRGIQVR